MSRHNPILKAREDGRNEANLELRNVVFEYLEKKYMDPGVDRGSDRGKAIIEITRELSELLKVDQ